jgi:hypothetical protein
MISVTELICFFIGSDGYISTEVQNSLSKAYKETKGPKQYGEEGKL